MIKITHNDGDSFDLKKYVKQGFILDEKRDIRLIFDGENYKTVFNFVGFISNEDNDLLIVFPKKYHPVDKNQGSKLIFELLNSHKQKRPDVYIGDSNDKKYVSNFPFSHFFVIYNYYKKNGLYVEKENNIKKNKGKTINWKTTIRLSQKYIINNNLLFDSYYYNNSNFYTNFITDCLVYAINYTIKKFNIFVGFDYINNYSIRYSFFSEYKIIVDELKNIKSGIFNDKILCLVDSLIMFYSHIKIGGNYYLKHYSFYSIWEDMANVYLNNNFIYKNNGIFFEKNSKLKNFKKVNYKFGQEKFQVELDHFYIDTDQNIAFLFDSKYKNKINKFDYKQFSYTFIVRDYLCKKGLAEHGIVNALILPTDKSNSIDNFFDGISCYFDVLRDIKISIIYLNIDDVIRNYLS
jgi:hypothetical protein